MFESLLKSTRPAGKVPALPATPFGRISILCGLALLAIAGCSKKPTTTTAAIAPPKPDPWILSCNDPNAEEPALLWNGLLGVRIGRDGTFVGNLFEIGTYEQNGEEKILPLPPLQSARWQVDGEILRPEAGTNYLQTLDMRTGVLNTQWEQRGIKIKCSTELGLDLAELDQNWSFTNVKSPIKYKLESTRPTTDYEMKVLQSHAKGQPFEIKVDNSELTQDSSGHVVANISWRKTNDQQVDHSTARLLGSLNQLLKTDIQIDGPVEDQQAIRSFMYYLRSAIHPKGKMSISPFGLSDATYNGHVFWDADTWVFPALALIDPERAKAIADYRIAKFGKNRPGLIIGKYCDCFPWESSVSGKEVAPQAMQKEIHINGDVAWMLDNAAALGLVKQQDADKIIKKVAEYYLVSASDRPDGKFDLKDVVSPDEFHTGDNDLYTNLLANWTQKRTKSKLEFYLPRDKETYLTYDNDPIRGYKQAAAVLGIYPLQMINDEEARKMMDRYADKVTKNGPAMSHSVHALIWARLGESDKAYDEWKKSWQLYTNHPLMLFSEKPKKKTTYFTTGAAGCLQTVLYGFLGFRIDYEKDKMAAWSTPLNNGKWISIHPRLPAKWKSVKFTNFTVKGKRYNLTIDASGVKVNQGEP